MNRLKFILLFLTSIFSLSMLFSEDADDDFLNMIESALQEPEIPGQDEVSSPYQEGLDDGNVQVSREAQTDD